MSFRYRSTATAKIIYTHEYTAPDNHRFMVEKVNLFLDDMDDVVSGIPTFSQDGMGLSFNTVEPIDKITDISLCSLICGN